MKSRKILKQASKRAKNHFVRKKDFKKLSDEVARLREALQKLEGCCGEAAMELPDPKTKQTETAKPAAAAAPTGSAADSDLKQINGIGAVLEGKLNALGITSIGQVADFTQADIDRISEHLNFKGRIERDQWVQQAQELSKN